VYWSNEGAETPTDPGGPAAIWTIPIGANGPAVQLVSGNVESDVGAGGRLAVDSSRLVWSGLDDAGNAAVWTMPKGGGPQTLLASGHYSVIGLEIDAVNAYFWSRELSDGGYPATVWSVPLGGAGTATPLVQNMFGAPATEDAENLYLVDGAAGALLSLPKTGGATSQLCGEQVSATSIARDATHLYWAIDGSPGDQGGMILSMPLP